MFWGQGGLLWQFQSSVLFFNIHPLFPCLAFVNCNYSCNFEVKRECQWSQDDSSDNLNWFRNQGLIRGNFNTGPFADHTKGLGMCYTCIRKEERELNEDPNHKWRQIVKWGRRHIFTFSITTFFWNWLFLRSVNVNIWVLIPHLTICRRLWILVAPPIIAFSVPVGVVDTGP